MNALRNPHPMLQSIDLCRIKLGQTMLDALRSIDASGVAIALVEQPDGKVAGTLTDGDVRRALLRGATLETAVDAHAQRQFTAVGPTADRSEVLDLMQSRRIAQIPILDDEGRLVGLHTLQEMLGAAERPNWAVVMAGGRGERLRPITDTLPKPMIKVAGRPILERIVLHLVGFGIRRVFLAVNYLGSVIQDHFGDGTRFGCRIDYLSEQKQLGTGGALSLLNEKSTDALLVLNGDILTQINVASLLEFHQLGRFRATLAVHDYVHTVPYGVVERDGDRVTRLREKPTQSWLANAGIYVVEPALVERVPKDTFFPLPALVEECLDRDEPVGAFCMQEDWIDVGMHNELRRARGEEVK